MTISALNPPPLGVEQTTLEWRHFMQLVGPPSMIAGVQSSYKDSHRRLVRDLILTHYQKLAKERDDIVFAQYQDILLVTYDGLSVVLRVVEIREDEPDPAEKYRLRMADDETARFMIERYKQQLVLEENRAELREKLRYWPQKLAAVENLMYYRDMFSKGDFAVVGATLLFVSEQQIISHVTPLVQDSVQISEIATFLEELGSVVHRGDQAARIQEMFTAQEHKPDPWQLLLKNKTSRLRNNYPDGGFLGGDNNVTFYLSRKGMAPVVTRIYYPQSAQKFIDQLDLPRLNLEQARELGDLLQGAPRNL
jgi:hypothetical protein